MAYLKEISDVHSENNILIISGYRTDSDRLFWMEITKNENENWVRKKAVFFAPRYGTTPISIIESLSGLADLDKQARWDALFEELIIHPKVRLHTLF